MDCVCASSNCFRRISRAARNCFATMKENRDQLNDLLFYEQSWHKKIVRAVRSDRWDHFSFFSLPLWFVFFGFESLRNYASHQLVHSCRVVHSKNELWSLSRRCRRKLEIIVSFFSNENTIFLSRNFQNIFRSPHLSHLIWQCRGTLSPLIAKCYANWKRCEFRLIIIISNRTSHDVLDLFTRKIFFSDLNVFLFVYILLVSCERHICLQHLLHAVIYAIFKFNSISFSLLSISLSHRIPNYMQKNIRNVSNTFTHSLLWRFDAKLDKLKVWKPQYQLEASLMSRKFLCFSRRLPHPAKMVAPPMTTIETVTITRPLKVSHSHLPRVEI